MVPFIDGVKDEIHHYKDENEGQETAPAAVDEDDSHDVYELRSLSKKWMWL